MHSLRLFSIAHITSCLSPDRSGSAYIKLKSLPWNHPTNRVETAIWTFKNHLLSMIETVDNDWPLYLWNKVLFSKVSSRWALCVVHDQTAHFRLTSCTRQIRSKRNTLSTCWDKCAHVVEGFYLGPAMLHYCCYTCWATATAAIWVTDTVTWHPSKSRWQVRVPKTHCVHVCPTLPITWRRLVIHPHWAISNSP